MYFSLHMKILKGRQKCKINMRFGFVPTALDLTPKKESDKSSVVIIKQ